MPDANDLLTEKLECGCDNIVSVKVTVEAFIPASHWNNPVDYRNQIVAAAVDELVDENDWSALTLTDPQPAQSTLNPPHDTVACMMMQS